MLSITSLDKSKVEKLKTIWTWFQRGEQDLWSWTKGQLSVAAVVDPMLVLRVVKRLFFVGCPSGA